MNTSGKQSVQITDKQRHARAMLRELYSWCRAKGDYLAGSSVWEEICEARGYRACAHRIEQMVLAHTPHLAPVRAPEPGLGWLKFGVWILIVLASMIASSIFIR